MNPGLFSFLHLPFLLKKYVLNWETLMRVVTGRPRQNSNNTKIHTHSSSHHCFINTTYNFRLVLSFNRFVWRDPSCKIERLVCLPVKVTFKRLEKAACLVMCKTKHYEFIQKLCNQSSSDFRELS